MFARFLIERFETRPDALAVVAPTGRCTFGELTELCRHWSAELDRHDVAPGTVVGLRGDFSPNAIALFVALADRGAIVVPQGNDPRIPHAVRDEIAQLEVSCLVDAQDRVELERTGRHASHEIYDELRRRGHPGLVGFSSGTSGEPKAVVHDLTSILDSFHTKRAALSTLTFLLFDHLGGIRTMLHALSNTVTIVSTDDRSPEGICVLIEEHGVELLPTTPTFLTLLLLSGAHRRHDLSSLRVISYGAEPMPQSTLDRLSVAFPGVKLHQTYGLIEIGPPSSKSRGDGSLWVKIEGDDLETRVVDGILQMRSPSTMLGYLNAPSPITPDGWLVTGDAVEQDGEYLRFLGRKSELINVGGEKVYPAEVENVILELDSVEEVTVYGERNPLVGQIVCARIKAAEPVDASELATEVKRHCRERLERFKVPVRVTLTDERHHSERFKKLRTPDRREAAR